MMDSYPKPGNQSAIDGYEIYPDKIYVRFKGGSVYGYSNASAGKANVDAMKRLAEDGEGLSRFIKNHVYNDYCYKGTENDIPEKSEESKARSEADKGIAKMPPALRRFDFRWLIAEQNPPHYPVEVFYSDTVEPADMVPGLKEFVEIEYEHIIRHMACFFHDDCIPRDIFIELSDLHKVCTFGTMTDSKIVNEIQAVYKQYINPDPLLVKQILANRKTTSDLLGTYHMEPRHIKLYYRMFDVSQGPEHYLAQVRKTLAHELLHAKHHLWAPNTFPGRDFPAVKVKESLADFYAFLYMLEPEFCCWGNPVFYAGLDVTEKRFYAWKERLGSSWPYAYAFMFLSKDDRMNMPYSPRRYDYEYCLEKYMAVWETSRAGMANAEDILMNW